jgi:hypothetical protein
VAEMCADLPSSDATFEASTSAEFLQLVTTSAQYEFQTRSLKDIVALFLQDDCTSPGVIQLVPIKVEHLTTIMFGKSLRLHSQFSSLTTTSLPFSYIRGTYWSSHICNL